MGGGVVQGEDDLAQSAAVREVRGDLVNHRRRRAIDRKASHARPQRGKRDRAQPQTVGQPEGAARGRTDARLAGGEVLSHRHRVDHVAGRQPAGAGGDGFADGHRTPAHRLLFDLRSAALLDRAGHTPAHPEVVVGGIHDRLAGQRGDISLDDADAGAADGVVTRRHLGGHGIVGSSSSWLTP